MTPAAFRTAALGLPEAVEQETWERPTFRVRGKIFAMLAADGATATVKAAPEVQAELVASTPAVYAVAPYVGRFGWVLVSLRAADAGEVRELLLDAWRATAPRRLARGA